MENIKKRNILYFEQDHLDEGATIIQNRINNGEITVIAYDSEFTHFNGGRHILSLIQLATDEEVYLFHVHGIKEIPYVLGKILKNNIPKIGFALQQDYIVFRDTFRFTISFLDIQILLNATHGVIFSLKNAVEKFCGYTISKSHSGVVWRWDRRLDDSRKIYAAQDAYACYDLWSVIHVSLKMNSLFTTTNPTERAPIAYTNNNNNNNNAKVDFTIIGKRLPVETTDRPSKRVLRDES